MPYTVWSRGRLVGETDLGYVRCIPKWRMGWFHPSAKAEALLTVVDERAPVPHPVVPDLELHREDGSLVATDIVGIQDTHALLRFAENDLANLSDDADELFPASVQHDPELEEAMRSDAELIEQLFAETEDDWAATWIPDEIEDPRYPRYQIIVQLLDDDAIP